MQVFLIRHAEAVPEAPAVADRDRHLTLDGRAQALAIGDRLRWHDCTPTQIWASPLVRAIQTAELIATGVESALAVEAHPALAPDGEPAAVVAELRGLAHDAIAMLVGHGPLLSRIGALLTSQSAMVHMRRAEAVRIEDGVERWRFAWDGDAPVISARGG